MSQFLRPQTTAKMYPFPLKMMPHPEPAWACVGVCRNGAREHGDNRGYTSVTSAGTNRDFSCEGTDPIGGSAWVIGLPNAKAMTKMRRNKSEKKRKKSKSICVVRTQIMRPRLLELAHCRTSALRVKVVEQKGARIVLAPFCFMSLWLTGWRQTSP